MLYAFRINPECRRRIFKAKTIVVSPAGIERDIIGKSGTCEHGSVKLTRSSHFAVLAVCQKCDSILLRQKSVYINGRFIVAPKVNLSKEVGGDSRLPSNDPRL